MCHGIPSPMSKEQHWSRTHPLLMWMYGQVRPAAETRAMSLSTWPTAPSCAHSAVCPRATTTTHTKSAPCATSQMKDQTSMFTIGSQSKLLITLNLMCSSWEITPWVRQLNCVFSLKRCCFYFKHVHIIVHALLRCHSTIGRNSI